MNPISIHIANISRPRRQRRSRVVHWLSFELIVLALTLAGITGMLLGMVLRNAFAGTP